MPSDEDQRKINSGIIGIIGGFVLVFVLGLAISDNAYKQNRKNWPEAPKEYASGAVRTVDYHDRKILGIYPKEAQKPLVYVCNSDFSGCKPKDEYLLGVSRDNRKAEEKEIDVKVD